MLQESYLQIELEGTAKGLGADLFGVADLTIAQDFICKQGGEHLRKFSRAISIGIRLLDAVVDELYSIKIQQLIPLTAMRACAQYTYSSKQVYSNLSFNRVLTRLMSFIWKSSAAIFS